MSNEKIRVGIIGAGGWAKYGHIPALQYPRGSPKPPYLYAAYARDRKNETSEASNFRDAVRHHQLIDQIVQTSENFFK
jgi:predicted dehydrogenase